MPISRDTKIGIGREATWGATAAPQVLLPVEAPTVSDPYEVILDNLLRGVNAVDFGSYQGSGHAEVSLSGHFFPEEMGFILLAMMGSTTPGTGPEGTSPPYAHVFTMASQPPSLSLQDEGAVYPDSATERRYIGMLPSSLTLSVSSGEGLFNWSADFMGQKGEDPAAGAIPSEATSEPFRGWHASMSVNGSPNTRLIDAEISFEREVAIRHGADGTQYPAVVYSGGLIVTATFTADAEGGTELDRVLDHETSTLVISAEYGSGASFKKIEITFTNFNWGDAPATQDRSGVYNTIAITGRGLYNATDGGPCAIILTNSRANYDTA